jgi:hypothetical protein
MEDLLKYIPKDKRNAILAHRTLDRMRRIHEEH